MISGQIYPIGISREKSFRNQAVDHEAVKIIKLAILRSQRDALKSINEKQLMLYFAVGKYISHNSRNGVWGKGAIEAISERLDKELPGLRGFTARNLRYMRTFYEEWSILDTGNKKSDEIEDSDSEIITSKIDSNESVSIWKSQFPNLSEFPIEEFLNIGFTHHSVILGKVKELNERIYYIKRCAKI